MKKFLSLTVIVTLLCLVLAGCAGAPTTAAPTTGASEEPTAAPTTTAGEPVELTVWESTNGPDQWIEQAGEAFTAINPNITIKYVNVELGDSTSQIALDGPAGVGPDLFAAPHDKMGELVTGGHVLETADADEVKASVLAACAAAISYDGKTYGYPTSAETYALYYNKALIADAEVPKTWDDLKAWCTTFNTANEDKYGFVMDVTSMYYTILFTTQNGNRLFGASGTDTSSSYLNTQDAIDGMTVYQSLHDILPVASADMTTSVADGAFMAGTAAMTISGPWNVKNFADAGIDYGVTTLPGFTAAEPSASFSGTRCMFVSAYSEHPEEAALFAKFLISEDMQKLRNEITGALPSIDIEVSSEAAAGFIAQLSYAFPMPSIPQMSAFWESSGSASCNIWDGVDVKTELDKLDQAILASVG